MTSAGLMIEKSQVRVPARAGGEFSSPVYTFCTDSYFGMSSNPVLTPQHVKIFLSAKSVGGKLHLNTHTHPTYVAWNEM